MTIQQVLFLLFSGLMIFSAFAVITSRNSVRAALFLVLTFVCSSALWLLIEAEFLAIVLVLVYVGAVMVLFLFVVMMLDINIAPKDEGYTHWLPVAVFSAFLIVGQILYILSPSRFGIEAYAIPKPLAATYSNIQALGEVLYSQYILAFEVAAVILLIAMVSAVALTFRGANKRKSQQPGKQVQVKKEDRVRLVKMQPEK